VVLQSRFASITARLEGEPATSIDQSTEPPIPLGRDPHDGQNGSCFPEAWHSWEALTRALGSAHGVGFSILLGAKGVPVP
jgi:hypothetical protein